MIKSMTNRFTLTTSSAMAVSCMLLFLAGSTAAQEQSILDTSFIEQDGLIEAPVPPGLQGNPGGVDQLQFDQFGQPVLQAPMPVQPGIAPRSVAPQFLPQAGPVVGPQPAPQPVVPQDAVQTEEDLDLLMRAPLHEAFAEISQGTPTANPMIFRKPAEAIEELPPDYKPEGDNVLWIDGYWFWDEDRNDFIWISGIWRDAPNGQRWVPGYWHEEVEGGGFRWVSGFWTGIEQEEITYLPAPPEPIEVGPSMPAPSDDYFYVPGCWVYQQMRYVWRPGYYSAYIDDFVWVPPTYVWTPCGYVYRPGYWDRPMETRGMVFAPVYFRQPIYLVQNYYYRPSCVIDTGIGLLPHLFVRRNRCHYYFGDYYADRYVRSDYLAWSSIGNVGFYNRQFDPLYCYYRSPSVRYQNSSLIQWAQSQHTHCSRNINLRPASVFNVSIFNQQITNNNIHIHDYSRGVLPQHQVFLGNTLEQTVNVPSGRKLEREAKKYVRLSEDQARKERNDFERVLKQQRRELEGQNARNRVQPVLVNGAPNGVAIQPVKINLTKELRNAKNDAEKIQRDHEQAIKRQETAARIQQRQAEAAAKAQARKIEDDQRKFERANKNNPQPGNPQFGQGNPIPGQAVQNFGQPGQTNPRQPNIQGFNGQPGGVVNQDQLTREQRRAAEKQAADLREQLEKQQREAAKMQRREGVQQKVENRQQETLQERALRQQQEQQKDAAREQLRQQQQMQQQAEKAARQQRDAQEAAQRQMQQQQQAIEAAKRQQQEMAKQQQDAARQQQEAVRQQQRQIEQQQRQAEDAARRQEAEMRRQQRDQERQNRKDKDKDK